LLGQARITTQDGTASTAQFKASYTAALLANPLGKGPRTGLANRRRKLPNALSMAPVAWRTRTQSAQGPIQSRE
jgi:hypothetical protein